MCQCFSAIPVNQEESQRNNALITKVKISEHIMIAEDPTVIDYPREFHTPRPFVPFRVCLERKPPGSSRVGTGEGDDFSAVIAGSFGDREGLSSDLGTCKS